MTSFPQTILMCSPDHFKVVYEINPWMEGQFANTDSCGVDDIIVSATEEHGHFGES
ncbi:MAG: hypothetical protein WA231_09960 [Methylocella sp.]